MAVAFAPTVGAVEAGEHRAPTYFRRTRLTIALTHSNTQAGEKRAQEESGELLGVKDKGLPNAYTQELLAEMASWEAGFVERDGYLLYLSVPDTSRNHRLAG